MSNRDKGNQKQTPKDMDARKPKSSKQAKEARKAKKLAKAMKHSSI